MSSMEVQPLTLSAILELLRERAVERKNSILVEARILVSSEGAQLLDVQPQRPVETISY